MSASVLFVSDLHLGHRTILKHCPQRGGTTVLEHDEWVMSRLMAARPGKRTLWWFLGDVAMEPECLKLLDAIPGRKRLVLGNHDLFDSQLYLKYFERLYGITKKYDMWLSHAPVHPNELRDHFNVHGHCHADQLRDTHYLNVALEHLPDFLPVSLEVVREHFHNQRGVYTWTGKGPLMARL